MSAFFALLFCAATAIFVAGLYNEAALIAKAARQDLGMDVPIIGGDGGSGAGRGRPGGLHT